MAGNLMEWCSSLWQAKAYPFQVEDEWTEAYLEQDGVWLLRGGSWYNDERHVRCAVRFGSIWDSWFGAIGVRVAVSPS